jgi:plasmid stability protein
MDTTIRNLDEQAYKALRARAVLEGRTVGEVINEAIRGYLARPTPGKRSLREWKPIPFPPGNENLSSEIDQVLYGSESEQTER